jgi:hypothetical protein
MIYGELAYTNSLKECFATGQSFCHLEVTKYVK